MNIEAKCWITENAGRDFVQRARIYNLAGLPLYCLPVRDSGGLVATASPPSWGPRARDEASPPAVTTSIYTPLALDDQRVLALLREEVDRPRIFVVQEYVAALVRAAARDGDVVLVARTQADGSTIYLRVP